MNAQDDADFNATSVTPGFTSADRELDVQRWLRRDANIRLSIKLAFVLALLFMALTTWLCRWQVIELRPDGDGGPAGALVINRITGEVRYMTGRGWAPIDDARK